MALLRWARILATHDYLSAWRVRTYWRIRRLCESGGDDNSRHLPCLFCVHDVGIDDNPIWLWCNRPSRKTADRYGNLHHLGCDWGNC